MGKNFVILVLLVAVAWFGYTLYQQGYFAKYLSTPASIPAPQKEQVVETKPCAQVITSARDPKTGAIKEYPTPCDVPKEWEVIQNDIPGFDIQVQ